MDLFFVLLILTLGLYSVDTTCNSPENISGATLVVVGSSPYPDGTQVEYTCNIGYRPYGDSKLYTCQGGVWVGNFECKKITCSYKAPPANGKYSTSPTYEIGTEMRLECYSGYDRNGPSRLLCMADGTWDPDQETTCTPKNCRDFGSVMHGNALQNIRDGIRNSYGSVVTITCDDSYVIEGSPHVECQASGSWGDKPSCELVSCPTYPGASTGCVDYTELSSNNRILDIFCKSGPNISVTQLGEYDVYCNDNQVWEGDPLACYCDCKVVVNETQVTVNNLESNGFLKHGRTLSWTCKKGLKNMTENVVCKDGVIGTNLCVPACEKDPKVDNAEVVPPGKPPYPENSHVDLECDYGYRQKEGTIQRYTCTQHVWMGGNLTCEQIVKVFPHIPTPEHGKKIGKSHYMIQIGDTIEFECNSFYKLEGPESMTSTLQGTWEPAYPPVCELFVELIILVIVLAILVVFLVVLYILYKLYRIIETVIQSLLNDANMITEVLLKDTVQEAIKTLEDTWNPLKDSFVKFVLEITKCKLTNLAEKKKTLWKLNCKHLRSQADKDLEKVEKYKIYITAEVLAWEDFERNVDQLLKSAKVAATIPLYKPHWFSKLRQSKPDNYVNEQTKAKSHILEVKAWLDKQKKEGGDTKTEDLDTLMPTLQSEEIWRPFTQLKKSLETIMHFWSANPETGEDEETLL